jgi:hypothetical protein
MMRGDIMRKFRSYRITALQESLEERVSLSTISCGVTPPPAIVRWDVFTLATLDDVPPPDPEPDPGPFPGPPR